MSILGDMVTNKFVWVRKCFKVLPNSIESIWRTMNFVF